MTIDTERPGIASQAEAHGVVNSAHAALRGFAIATGIAWSIAFVVVGMDNDLEMYGDGSIFSYAVAVQDSWAFHFHNIAGRAFVWLFSMLPAEAYVALTQNAHGSVALYGFLFYVTQLLGLIATWLADGSRGRIIFATACASTAIVCPMVFGAPTETWMSHALFWPTLAFCHYARVSLLSTLTIFLALLALLFTHAGAFAMGFVIIGSLWLRGSRDPAFRRTALALMVALFVQMLFRFAFPPDDYIAAVLFNAALHILDPSRLAGELTATIAAALAGYTFILILLRRLSASNAEIIATFATTSLLAMHWLWFDHGLHADHRYFLRTFILLVTPALGALAAACALTAEGRLIRSIPLLPRTLSTLENPALARAALGALVIITLIHVVETEKFVAAWNTYKAAVRSLAMSQYSDPDLGDPRFVSAARIDRETNRAKWNSTTPYLSVLLAPGLAPNRLVVDPDANYFWISCATASENLAAMRAVPAGSRALIRTHACLHR